MPTPAVLPPAWRPVVAAFALLTAWLAPLGAHAQAQAVPDPERGDVRLVVFGDFNGPYGSLTYPAPVSRVVDAIVHVWRPDGVLLPGDLVAGQDRSLPDERFPAMWAAFDAAVAAPLRAAGIPYLATMGNHDASSLRDLMLAGDVDLYVSGHQAAYYPGRWEVLELLFAGGVGARALRVGDAPRRSAVTLVDVWLEPLRLRYTTLDPSGFVPHDPAALPASLDAFGGLIERSERDDSCALPGC